MSAAVPSDSRPWVSLNMAMTLDGKIATENRRFASFGSPRDQARLYELRARADAVMTGAGTLRAQDVDLNSGGTRYQRLRRRRGLSPENLRIVVSSSGNLPPAARLFREPGGPIVILTSQRGIRRQNRVPLPTQVQMKAFGKTQVAWPEALKWLRREAGVRRLHCEGGGDLNESLFRAGVVDEIFLTLCPLILAGRSAPTIADGLGIPRLAEGEPFAFTHIEQHGDEVFLRLQRTGRIQRREPRAT